MQAIVTKFLGPTNARPARIVATCDAKRIVVSKEYGRDENGHDDHEAAAMKLANLLGWGGKWCKGGLPGRNSDCVFVWVKPSRKGTAKATLIPEGR